MLALRVKAFNEVHQQVDQIESLQQPHLKFSSVNSRQRNENLGPAIEVLSALIEKAVGCDEEDQVGFLMYHLKKLSPSAGVLAAAVDHFTRLKEFNSTSEKQRKSIHYKTFDKLLVKVSGTNMTEIHETFFK